MLLLLAALSCIIQHSLGYNLETELPVIRRGDTGSYFGFSVASHSYKDFSTPQRNHSWMLVGAPKGNRTALPQIESPGVVYKCDFATNAQCSELELDKKGNINGDQKENGWFGVSVMSEGHDANVMACSHRLLHIEGSFYTYPGRCLRAIIDDGNPFRTKTQDYCELRNQNTSTKHKVAILKICPPAIITWWEQVDDQGNVENVPLIGAPGVYNYQGEFIYYSREQMEVYKGNSPHGYQGYALAQGSFFKAGKNDVASGAPRFDHHGMVAVFRDLGSGKFQKDPKVLLPPVEDGSDNRRQPGTGFGIALCAEDLNNDGLSELLVGAPFYSDDLYPEQGRVYVYEYKGSENKGSENKGSENLVLSHKLPIGGRKDRWRGNFGRALASVGDIDLDGYQDVAVGAPYEDSGDGTVYIYRGSEKGLVETPMQVIKGSSVSPGIQSFGYSIAGILDLDTNGYPDVVIGAYQSDTAVLLRSKPVISILSKITIYPDTFDIKGRNTCNQTEREGNKQFATSCFDIKVCTKYTERSRKVKEKIDVLLIMKSDTDPEWEADSRVLFQKDQKNAINRTELIGGNDTCFYWFAYIREGVTDADVYPDIQFTLTYQIVKEPTPTVSSPTDVPSLVPFAVFDPLKPQQATAVLSFKRDCKKCVPDLKIDVSNSKKTLAVGAKNYKLTVTVKNDGDDAYNAKFFVTIPRGMQIGKIFSVDKEIFKGKAVEVTTLASNDTFVTVKLNTPFKKKEQPIQIVLDTSRYSDTPDFLPIHLNTNSTNEEDSDTLADNNGFLNISIKSQADLEINGTTVEEQVAYGGKVVGESAMVRAEDIGNEVIHKYFVKNRGPDPVPLTEVIIEWPFEATSGKHLLYLVNVKVDGNRASCKKIPGQLNMLGLETSAGGSSGQQQNDTSVDAMVERRRRRDVEDTESSSKVKRETEPTKPEKLQSDLDCKLGFAKCTNIHCTIERLKADEDVTFTVISRLWNGTMIEDYQGELLRVISHASVRSTNTYVQETNKENNKAQVGTQLNPDVNVAVPSKGLPKWVIPVCVVSAVLLLVLIVFCLYKLGFFKRQKFDKNITDPEEVDRMLDNGKGYYA
ncbi:Integrin alpha-6 [Stylophora pistillata]|uniref:Integrin alpha-6 n=2 Tax=Stylophora pistillata TaxID=50429 RepID=A0A2B4RYG9_STYPI|nr:Integrin alpha-6 [Stylophora pistillata]